MSQTVITKAFVEWKAQQAADNQPVTLDEFIFALVPDLDVTKPIDNTESIPTDKIVYRQAVSKTGVVNANSVVYSVTMGADVGDFDFNWIGLTNKASGTLAMIIHAPTQRKIQNASGQQGNVLVRSMLMEYNGAQAATNITTPAETWQIDFTARLAGMDEADRLAALDIYGTGAFFENGFLVAKTGTQYYVTKGLGYVGGLRAELAANQNVAVSAKPIKVWADVSYQGTLTSAYKTAIAFRVAATLENYIADGVAHYVFSLASIDAAGAITDLRPKGSLADQTFLRKDKNLTDIANPATALKTLGGVPTVRTINKKALNADITLSPSDVGALPSNGTAVAAQKLETARKIADVEFDGTKDISLNAGNVGAVPSTGGDVGYLDNSAHYHIKAGAWEGAGGFAQQYSNPIAPFLIPHGYMAPQDSSSYAPIIKGVIQTKKYGYGTAISFGAYTGGDANFARACIHAIGDNGVQAVWQFNPNDSSFYSPGPITTAGNITCNGLYNSLVNTGRMFVYLPPSPGEGQGTHIGWNETGSKGESDFVNNRGGGSGGFHFRIVNTENTVETGNVIISGTGDLTTTGNLNTGAAGGVYDQGQRVYSPNNPQPNIVQDMRFGSSAEYQERSNNEHVDGGVMTSFKDSGSSNYWIRIRQLQKLINNNWYTVNYT